MSNAKPDPIAMDYSAGDPFTSRCAVPVAGGALAVARSGPSPAQADVVVLAIHGITSNGMVWRSVARELPPSMQVSVLAPDLRGRGDSAALPGPYGIAAHVADLISVLDHLDVERVVLVGHSMGAYVAARIAAEHPARAAGLVLVDGGTPSDLTEEAASGAHAFLVGPALVRQAMPFMSAQAYLAFWQQHPAFAPAWNDDVEGYVLHDLHGRPGAFRYIVSVEALHADSGDMLSDPANQPAIKAEMPLYVLRARRGLLGDENPLIPQATWDAFITEHPTAHVEDVASVSHYSLVLGDSAGPQRVTAAILAAARAATSA